MKTMFGDTWKMADESHPVDMPMAEAALRADLAMRFAVYNELEHKLSRDKAPQAGGSAGAASEGIPSGPNAFRDKPVSSRKR